jgi:hypothetical protein
MEASSIVSASSALTAADTQMKVQVSLLKRTLAIETENAQALLDALPTPAANLPAHLGQTINTRA